MNKHKLVTPSPFDNFKRGSDALNKILYMDPVATAEEEFGVSHDKFTDAMKMSCMRGSFKLSNMKTTLLKETKDTYSGIEFVSVLNLLTSNGFKKGYYESFLKNMYTADDKKPEQYDAYELYYRVEDGLVVEIESYGSSVNRLTLYGNLNVLDMSFMPYCSYAEDNGVVRFEVDVREGLFHIIERLKKSGELLPIWSRVSSGTWFVNRNVYKDHDIKFTAKVGYEKTLEKYVQFPEEMQQIMKIYYDTFWSMVSSDTWLVNGTFKEEK